MRNLLLFFHLAAAIFWMGGMGFMLLALRPAVASLQPPDRLRLLAEVLRRFFWVVGISIVLLLLTGVAQMASGEVQAMPRGWHAMAGIGVVMMLLFAHIVASPYRRLRRAVAASDWPEGARRIGQIARFVQINFALGWIAILSVLLWR